MPQEKILFLSKHIESIFKSSVTFQKNDGQYITYSLVLNGTSAVVNFQTNTIVSKTIGELSEYLDSLNLEHMLAQTDGNVLTITE